MQPGKNIGINAKLVNNTKRNGEPSAFHAFVSPFLWLSLTFEIVFTINERRGDRYYDFVGSFGST